jgi:cold shock CspA family protein/Tfp pilus assembly protein PilF
MSVRMSGSKSCRRTSDRGRNGVTHLLDRNRLYALIGALEDDLREVIRTHLVGSSEEHDLLGGVYDKAAERFGEDADAMAAGSDIIDYLDLGDEIGILNRNRRALPAGIQDSLAASSRQLDDLVGIRNRVMHRRPLLPDDHDNAARWLEQLQSGGFQGESLKTTLRQLRADPDWSPTASYAAPSTAATINNLPIPDFDETGLVGRRRQVEKLKRLLTQSRFPVITLIGPGGVGKTALALQVLHELAEDRESRFDLIAWVSLKTEYLTAAGVQVIHDAVRSVEQAVPSLAAPLDEFFKGSAGDLAQSFEGINAVLAIDNLETVSAAEVLALVDELPPTVTCLFTSRVGLGEVERREVLGPLEMPYATDLFRRLSRARQLEHLAKLADARVEELLAVLGTSPLAIKWFILAVDAGQAPETILKHQTDLIRFCVQNVYQGLSERAKDAAVVLAHVNRPLNIQDMKLHFQGITPDELRAAVQELIRCSLCGVSIPDDSITEHFQATDSLVEFLRVIGGASENLLDRVQRTEDEYRRAEERLRLEQGRTPLRVNVISGASEHRASALRLREALGTSAKGNASGALQVIDEVEQLDPEYWELFRVRGFILSQLNRVDEATHAYEQALALAPDEESRARVQYFYAGHLVRKVRHSEGALTQARAAHRVLQRPETALELGKALTYVRDFSSALELLRYACRTSEVRGQLIAGTQLVDTLRRRAEVEADELRSPQTALNTLNEAVGEGTGLLASGIRDQRLEEELYKVAADGLRVASRMTASEGRDDGVRALVSSLQLLQPLRGGKSRMFLAGQVAKMLAIHNLPEDLVTLLAPFADLGVGEQNHEGDPVVPIGAELVGTIKTWKAERGFGFITAIDGSGDYFFHAVDLEQPLHQIFLAHGVTVRFTVAMVSEKPRALMVALHQGPDPLQLKERRLIVRNLSHGYLWARDEQSGVMVFVGRHMFDNQQLWERIREGDVLVADVEQSDQDRFAAVQGSVTAEIG